MSYGRYSCFLRILRVLAGHYCVTVVSVCEMSPRVVGPGDVGSGG